MHADSEPQYVTSGLLRLTRPQLIGTMAGMLLAALLAAIDQTIVGTAEPRIIGTATSSTIFFRSIGSTVGVAAFGSVMLTRYHDEFLQVFFFGAVIMVIAVVPHLFLKREPLRSRTATPDAAAAVH